MTLYSTSLALLTLDCVTFAPIMQLKMRHISCWNVPYVSPLEIIFPSLFEDVVWEASSHSFDWTTKLALASISQRTVHPATLEINWFETIMMHFQSH